jgi:hypothetical protein
MLHSNTISIVSLLVVITFFLCITAYPKEITDGSITVDGKAVNIKHAAARSLFDDIVILLTDKPVPKEMVPDGILRLSEEGEIRGIMFSISSKNKRLLGKGESIQSIYFYPVWEQLGNIGNGQLEITTSDENTIQGKIFTPAENEWGEHTFSYNIEFTADIKKEPLKVNIKGDTDAPSKAFSKYYRAVMAGNAGEFKKYIAKARLKEIEAEPGMMDFFIEMQQVMSPTSLEIISSLVKKDRALLMVKGSRGAENSRGTIDMILEDGKWKVNLESWETSNLN